MFKGAITIAKDGTVEGDPVLFSLIKMQSMLVDEKKEAELIGSPWCG